PLGRAGGSVPDARDAVRVDRQLLGGRPLGAEGAAVDGAFGVALDVDDALAADVDQLAAADGAVRADARHLADAGDFQVPRLRLGGTQIEAEAEQAAQREAAGGGGLQESP